ncbi:hypothetical protein M0812_14058 [Anaeramoeba flamelloides]|uniref:Tyr recombinase domain-containing protein n=1 Tax=Anaeramoeba flamelloides TaxID=1746091 RepID=A0AAV7ZH17_9EUKA|nr:hypothetical protein M0812_14058 [Anaeramoeba flamelloides]
MSSQELIKESEKGYINKNTESIQEMVAKRFRKFLEDKEENRELTEIPLKDLDRYIVVFISRMKKKNKESYSWNSYRTMVHCLISYLRRVWQKHELEDYPSLEKLFRTQATLDRNLNRLKEENKVGKHTDWLTNEEEDRFLSSLNIEDPYDLLVSAFWLMGVFTGFRGGEYYKILQKDLSWEEEDGENFIKIIQRVKKNNQGTSKQKGCFQDFKLIFNYPNAKFNPYEIIKKYYDNCPKRDPDDSFWCSVNWSPNRNKFYKDCNVSASTLRKYLQKRITNVNINKKITFHSTRSTAINKFRRKGVKDSEGMFFTGHQSKSGYNCYKRQDRILNKQIAEALCHRSMETENETEKKVEQELKRKRTNSNFVNVDDECFEKSKKIGDFDKVLGNIKLINCSNINFNFYSNTKK